MIPPLLRERAPLFGFLKLGGRAVGVLVGSELLLIWVPAAMVIASGALVKEVEAGAGSGSFRAALLPFAVICVSVLLEQTRWGVLPAVEQDARISIDGAARQVVRSTADAAPTLIDLADSQLQEDLTRVSDVGHQGGRVRTIGAAAVGQLKLTARMVSGLVLALVLARFSIVLAVVVVAVSLLVRAVIRRQWMELAAVGESMGPWTRRATYWSGLAYDPRVAGEVRLFGLADWITARFRVAQAEEADPILRAWASVIRGQWLVMLMTFGAVAVGVVPVVVAAYRGDIDVSELVTYLGAVMAIVGTMSTMGFEAYEIEHGRGTVRALERLQARSAEGRVQRDAAHPGCLVELDRVGFRYPGGAAPVLDGCDLRIAPGEVLGLVGVNGSGKTTLIEMILGLLEPDTGEVRIDPDARAVAVFQDLLHYPLSLRDNVLLAAPEGDSDDRAVIDALERAGAGSLVERLPHGLDTVLQRDLPSGTDLSGGQWQRIAIARAVYAVAAGRHLVVMDEPTAQLDVRAEASFYQQLVETLPGATVVLISHRLSTVRHADRIVMLSGGHITESGTHDELLTGGGEYATLFRLQASRFSDSAAGER